MMEWRRTQMNSRLAERRSERGLRLLVNFRNPLPIEIPFLWPSARSMPAYQDSGGHTFESE